MKFKVFSILITALLFSLSPLFSFGQVDNFFIMEEMLLESPSSKEINLIDFDLYWSADTYVPFGYQGRALPAKEGWVDISSYLKISGENPKNLKYSWFLDDVFQEYKSGYGRTNFRFGVRRNKGNSHTVLLKVFNENRSFLINKSITIPITDPDVVIYSALNNHVSLPYTISSKDSIIFTHKVNSFLALPYFFSISTMEDLEFNWDFANKTIKESSLTANLFGIEITNKTVTELLKQALGVFVKNEKESNQRAEEIININIY
jgi:hypothetical protein